MELRLGPEFTHQLETPNGMVEAIARRVDGFKCGHHFKGIATVIEPLSDNPMLILERPLGFNAVAQIIQMVRTGVDGT